MPWHVQPPVIERNREVREGEGITEEKEGKEEGEARQSGSTARGVAAWCCSGELRLAVDGWSKRSRSGRAPALDREVAVGGDG